jgi:hypothetical protein
MAAMVGAAVGGMIGYLYLTSGGRRFMDQLEPRLETVAREFNKLRRTLTKAQAVAGEGWRSLSDLAAEGPHEARSTARQTSPF